MSYIYRIDFRGVLYNCGNGLIKYHLLKENLQTAKAAAPPQIGRSAANWFDYIFSVECWLLTQELYAFINKHEHANTYSLLLKIKVWILEYGLWSTINYDAIRWTTVLIVDFSHVRRFVHIFSGFSSDSNGFMLRHFMLMYVCVYVCVFVYRIANYFTVAHRAQKIHGVAVNFNHGLFVGCRWYNTVSCGK